MQVTMHGLGDKVQCIQFEGANVQGFGRPRDDEPIRDTPSRAQWGNGRIRSRAATMGHRLPARAYQSETSVQVGPSQTVLFNTRQTKGVLGGVYSVEQGNRITVLYLEAKDESLTVKKVPAELVSAPAWRRALLVLCSGRGTRGRGTRRMQCQPRVRIVVGGTKIKRHQQPSSPYSSSHVWSRRGLETSTLRGLATSLEDRNCRIQHCHS